MTASIKPWAAVTKPVHVYADICDTDNMCGQDRRPRVDTLPEEKDGYVLHPDLLNSKLLEAQYAVRGELYLRAEELKKEGKQIIYTNGMPPPRNTPIRNQSHQFADPVLKTLHLWSLLYVFLQLAILRPWELSL